MSSIFNLYSHDIAIDLGTANTLVYTKGEGIVINEPSVVAINKNNRQILAIGIEAQKMVGRTPSHIVAVRPLVDGVVADFEVTEQMLKYFLGKIQQNKFSLFFRPRVLIGIPFGVSEVERRAVEEATLNAGAREVFLIEEPIAAALGARLPIDQPGGNMIVDIGGGTTEVAIISLGSIVTSQSLRVAGDKINESIQTYARDKLKLLIGERMAEAIKIRLASAIPFAGEIKTMPIRGRDMTSGLPKEIIINDEQARQAIAKPVEQIVSSVRQTIERAPAELVGDLIDHGIVLCGGGALMPGLAELISHECSIEVKRVNDPLTTVVFGAALVLEDLQNLRTVLLESVGS